MYVVQLVLQSVAEAQTYPPQLVLVGSWHMPLPSHVCPLVSVPSEQDAALPQVVPADFCWHVFIAVHRPVLPHSPFAMHRLCGSATPGPTPVQVPGLEPLQVWQRPQEAEWQQTPSTQVPLAHGAPAEQASPYPPPLVHVVPMQNDPLAQSVACVAGVHELLQGPVELAHA